MAYCKNYARGEYLSGDKKRDLIEKLEETKAKSKNPAEPKTRGSPTAEQIGMLQKWLEDGTFDKLMLDIVNGKIRLSPIASMILKKSLKEGEQGKA
ncbi:MAG: hypothetical protein V1493_04645 [Candidatus Diapherotrites archaeon]